MSKTGKMILWIVIAIIVIGGIWWWIADRGNVATAPSNGTSGEINTTSTENTSTTASTSYPQGDSDQSINQDVTNLNAQLSGLNSDNASVTQSMNDQSAQ